MKKRSTLGASMFEVLLVLAIAAAILGLSVRQYQSFKVSSDIEQMNADVDKIFQAATYYFRHNCNKNNALAPTNATEHVPLDIQTDLITAGYLSSNAILNNPIVDYGADNTYKGYKVQFNRKTAQRKVCTDGTAEVKDSNGNVTTPAVCNTYTDSGTIVGWRIQVSVAIRSGNLIQAIKNISDATCITSATGATVVACGTEAEQYSSTCLAAAQAMAENAPADGDPPSAEYLAAKQAFDNANCADSGEYNNYVSFIRGPSFNTNVEAQSGLWQQNHMLQQFKQMYETMPESYRLNVGHTTEYQYFYCGG